MTSAASSTKKGVVKTVIGVCIFIVVIVSMFVFKMSQTRILHVKELVSMGVITYEEPKPLDSFELIAHTGEPFTNASLEGQWTMLFFGFSNCGGFCPATLAILNSLTKQLEPDILAQSQFVMVSVDPARDTPEVLAEYVPNFNPEFIGVTGDFLTIKRLSNQFHIGFQKSDGGEENYDVSHGEQMILINPNGDYHGFIKSPFTIGQLKVAYSSIVSSFKTN